MSLFNLSLVHVVEACLPIEALNFHARNSPFLGIYEQHAQDTALYLSKLRPKLVKNKRDRNHDHTNEAQQRIAPSQPQAGIHWRPSKRQESTYETPQNYIRSNGRRRIQRVTIDNIRGNRKKQPHDAEPIRNQRNNRRRETGVVMCAPTIPE